MKANELRIGNLIRHNKTTQEVISIFTYMDNVPTLTCSPFERKTDITEFEPIPLTKEWLVKFGFDKYLSINVGDWLEMRWCDIYKTQLYLNDCELDTHSIDLPYRVSYVHELQNLYFALTGNELTIKQ